MIADPPPAVDFVIVSVEALRVTDSLTALTGEGFAVVGVEASDLADGEAVLGTVGTGGTVFPLEALIVPDGPDDDDAAAGLVGVFEFGDSLGGFGRADTFRGVVGDVAVDRTEAAFERRDAAEGERRDAAEGGRPTPPDVVRCFVPGSADPAGFFAFAAVLSVDIAEPADGRLGLPAAPDEPAAAAFADAVVLTLTDETADETDALRVLAPGADARSDFAVLYVAEAEPEPSAVE